MRSDVVTSRQAFTLACQGLLANILLICLSLLHLNFGGVNFGLPLLPLLAIYLWPYRANYIWSIWFVVMAGLFQDILSGGPVGLWVIVNCLLFILLDPSSQRSKRGFKGRWAGFAIFVIFGAILSCFLARIATGHWAELSVLLAYSLITIISFPIAFAIRELMKGLVASDYVPESF